MDYPQLIGFSSCDKCKFLFTNSNVYTMKKRQKVHKHIGRRRGMEQVISCDPAHKDSCRQGRHTAVQTLSPHPAFALAGHSSLPQLLGNCFRESGCAHVLTGFVAGQVLIQFEQDSIYQEWQRQEHASPPPTFFPQCLLQWHNALS